MSTIQQTEQEPEVNEPIIAFRCPPDVKRAARVRAAQGDTTMQDVCVAALEEYLGLREPSR